jgi:superfamily II DNA or RNA helicase
LGLLEQLFQDLQIYLGANKVQQITTALIRKSSKLKPIRVVTIQTMASLNKTNELDHLIDDVDALFIDEFHHSGSVSFTNLLPKIEHIYYRYGFTGTFLRGDNTVLDMWGFLSNKLYEYKASKAIKEGYLTPLKLKIHEIDGIHKMNYKKEYDANYSGNPEMLDVIHQIVQQNPQKQILILVTMKDKSGSIIHEYLNTFNIDNKFISGDDKKEVVNQTIKDFNDRKFNVLIGSSVIGEGIDVRSTDHLVMCQGGKSPVVIVQAIGRAVRLCEGKTEAVIHDFHFKDTKYMEKHFLKRMKLYEDNFEPEII